MTPKTCQTTDDIYQIILIEIKYLIFRYLISSFVIIY